MHEKLTRSDVEKIEEEIEYRKVELRPELNAAVKEARAQGDLSENFEYYAARKEKGANDSRIRYLERMIKTAKVIPARDTDGVALFDTVTLWVEEDQEEQVITLVTTLRQDPLRDKISKESPLGRAILGKKVGDTAHVQVNENYGYDVEIRKIEKGKDDESLSIGSY